MLMVGRTATGPNCDPFVDTLAVVVQESAATQMKAAQEQLFLSQREQNRNQRYLGIDVNRATGMHRPVRVCVTDDDGRLDGATHTGSAARAMLNGEGLVHHK
jgi:hypothetical protein